MSSTRHAAEDAPLSQERYMSSPEYVELRGISGNAVTAKAALLGHPEKRSLLNFLQGISLQPGGLQAFTREFVEVFKDRIGTPTMHRVGMKPGRKYDTKTSALLRAELSDGYDLANEFLRALTAKPWERAPQDGPVELYRADELLSQCRERLLLALPGFIIELCINPKLRFSIPGETGASMERERVILEEQFGPRDTHKTRNDSHYKSAELPWFRDIIGALFEYKGRHEEAARRDFVMTEVGEMVFETLGVCLETGKMVVVQGNSRIGKTTAAEAWCQQHLGEARFVSLNGVRNYSGVFRAIAKALGLPCSFAHSTSKVQARIEDMLQRSRLVLVLDEAHFLLSAAERTRTAPELIDWVNTALVNHHVPCALVCTPQLSLRMARHEHQAGWNADQWRGRVKRFKVLPEVPPMKDLRAVARKLLPGADCESIDLIVGYAHESRLNMPAVVDAVDEARLLARREGREQVTFEDIERAIHDYCAPSAAAMAESFSAARQVKPARRRPPVGRLVSPVQARSGDECCEAVGTGTRGLPAGGGKRRLSFEDQTPALERGRDPMLVAANQD